MSLRVAKISKDGKVVNEYVDSILGGKKHACKEMIQACKRYINDLESKKFDFRADEADEIIAIIESTFSLTGGEDKEGNPFRGKPLILQPWQKFVIYNLFGFYKPKTDIRRFTEGLIFIPKKNGKTPFAAALAWAFGLKYAASESKILLTSFTQMQSMMSFDFIKENLDMMKLLRKKRSGKEPFVVVDNNMEHSITGAFGGGKIVIQAFSGDPKDGLNGNFVIADEIHQYRNDEQYTYYQRAMKAYRNKLMLAITTAGEDTNSFCYRRLKTCQKILEGEIKDDSYFVFIAKADQNEDGSVDYTNPLEHEKANPSYGVTIVPEEMLREAHISSNEKGSLMGFLAKELNIYMPSIKAYFSKDKFVESDSFYNWTLEELAKLPIFWYGGVDLAKIKDLTAAVLYGNYNGVDIIIPHAWFPITRAYEKAKQDGIDLFGWQDDGFLDMCNSNTIQQSDVVKWFVNMRNMGFKVKDIRYDRTFGEEFIELMKGEKFKVTDQPQLYKKTTKGFQRIDRMSEENKLYYMHSEAYEYCIANVLAQERTGGYMEFSKIAENLRIDIFAASVFAAVGMLENNTKLMEQKRQLGV